jgi:hypothetical protein
MSAAWDRAPLTLLRGSVSGLGGLSSLSAAPPFLQFPADRGRQYRSASGPEILFDTAPPSMLKKCMDLYALEMNSMRDVWWWDS